MVRFCKEDELSPETNFSDKVQLMCLSHKFEDTIQKRY